ncbi:MAG TPA: hypothetical protein VGM05_02380, partial [Planctomycetaceae bacterium]
MSHVDSACNAEQEIEEPSSNTTAHFEFSLRITSGQLRKTNAEFSEFLLSAFGVAAARGGVARLPV